MLIITKNTLEIGLEKPLKILHITDSHIPFCCETDPEGMHRQRAQRDEAGSVKTVSVGGVTLKGSAVRAALGLRSACFEWETTGERLVFHVTGHGHGVGLSQHGANAMALSGADYREILTHYYTGVTVEPYPGAF